MRSSDDVQLVDDGSAANGRLLVLAVQHQEVGHPWTSRHERASFLEETRKYLLLS